MALKNYTFTILVAGSGRDADYDVTCLIGKCFEIMLLSPIEEVFPYLFLVLRRTWNSSYLVEVIPYDRWGQVFNSHIDMYLKLKIHHFVYT